MTAALPRAVVVALARYRQRWGLTLDQLAERTGSTTADLARYETGVATPEPDVAEALIAVLQLDDIAATALRAAAEGKRAEHRAEPARRGDRFMGWDDHNVCFVTTIGRRSGRPHESEVPTFVVDGDRLYLVDPAAGGARWLRDIEGNGGVSVRVDPRHIHTGMAVVAEGASAEAERARVLAARKYPAERDALAAAAVVVVDPFGVVT